MMGGPLSPTKSPYRDIPEGPLESLEIPLDPLSEGYRGIGMYITILHKQILHSPLDEWKRKTLSCLQHAMRGVPTAYTHTSELCHVSISLS
jgi:hypothetical protein